MTLDALNQNNVQCSIFQAVLITQPQRTNHYRGGILKRIYRGGEKGGGGG